MLQLADFIYYFINHTVKATDYAVWPPNASLTVVTFGPVGTYTVAINSLKTNLAVLLLHTIYRLSPYSAC